VKLIPRRIRQLMDRAQQARDAKLAASRSGVRRISAKTDAEFDAECERILREEPPAEGYIYLFVPEPLTEGEWLAKHPPAEQKQDME